MFEKYFIPPSTICYGSTPRGVAFQASVYSLETREQVGTVCNDGDGGATYFRPLYADNAKASTYADVEREATKNNSASEFYYEKLMDIAEGLVQ